MSHRVEVQRESWKKIQEKSLAKKKKHLIMRLLSFSIPFKKSKKIGQAN